MVIQRRTKKDDRSCVRITTFAMQAPSSRVARTEQQRGRFHAHAHLGKPGELRVENFAAVVHFGRLQVQAHELRRFMVPMRVRLRSARIIVLSASQLHTVLYACTIGAGSREARYSTQSVYLHQGS